MPATEERSLGRIASILILVAATLACLAPFAGKAFHIDDPLFIWAARQIQSHPLDFYGFTINWYGHEMPASQIIKNPPLASYYIAMAAYLFGWSETALHLALLIPAIGAVAGTCLLAKEFSARPLEAALIGLLAPVFLLSSTTVMCDTMMLSLFVWAVLLWVRGMNAGRLFDLVCASLLVALCSLTKYFGISLIPLLLIHSLAARRGRKHRALLLLIPVVILSLYQWATDNLYGRGLLMDAASYATETRGESAPLARLLVGLSFTGGCLMSAFFFAPLLWRRRILIAAAALIIAGASVLSYVGALPRPDGLSWGFTLQFSLFVAAGIHILFLAGHDLWKRREADSLLLFLWVAGTFLFATFVNWSVNGRSILPMAPAVGILVMRRLEEHHGPARPVGLRRTLLPLLPALMLSLTVAWADYRLADTGAIAATEISRLPRAASATLWFQGHWGFQYYMEKAGGRALNVTNASVSPGDLMVIPENNTNVYPELMKMGTPLQELRLAPASFVSTMNPRVGAGFYADVWGPLPFAFGTVPNERYFILGVVGSP